MYFEKKKREREKIYRKFYLSYTSLSLTYINMYWYNNNNINNWYINNNF